MYKFFLKTLIKIYYLLNQKNLNFISNRYRYIVFFISNIRIIHFIFIINKVIISCFIKHKLIKLP